MSSSDTSDSTHTDGKERFYVSTVRKGNNNGTTITGGSSKLATTSITSASAERGHIHTVTVKALTDDYRTAAFAPEDKVNSSAVHDTVKLNELYKTKGLNHTHSQRMLEKGPDEMENTDSMLHKDLGDMESDTDPGLFAFILLTFKLKSNIFLTIN